MKSTKQNQIDNLQAVLQLKINETTRLQNENDKLRQMLADKHTAEIAKLVTMWGQSNEAYSKAILALKGCL